MTIRNLLEKIVTRLKKRPFVIDPRLPLTVLFVILVRRAIWLARGLVKTTFLQGRPQIVFMGPRVSLRNSRMCHFGRGVTLETGVVIDGLSTHGIYLDDDTSIGAYSQIRASGLMHLGYGLRLGKHSACDAYSFLGAAEAVTIGKNVIMGQHVSFHPQNHIFTDTNLPIRAQGVKGVGITIDDDCWIGANVVFLDGALVGKGCVVAAGAVVRGTIPPYSVIAGVPAKVLRSRLDSAAPASDRA